MGILGGLLLGAAILIGAARLFTGIVYETGVPTALLVLKTHPSTWIERPEHDGQPATGYVVLDSEEPRLAYGRLYEDLIGITPILSGLMGLTAASLLLRLRRRKTGRIDRAV